MPSTTHLLSQYTAASSAQCVPPVLMGTAHLNSPAGVCVGFCMAALHRIVDPDIRCSVAPADRHMATSCLSVPVVWPPSVEEVGPATA